MAHIIKPLTTICAAARSAPPGRRAVAILLCAMLCLSALSPGLAAAGESDSEGEGTALPVEAPSPDFDPGGEESVLDEAPAADEEPSDEGEAVEAEPAYEAAASLPEEVGPTGEPEVVTPMEEPTAPVVLPEVTPTPEEPQPVPHKAQQESVAEPVHNQQLIAPEPPRQDGGAAEASDEPTANAPAPPEEVEDAPLPPEPAEEHAPAPPAVAPTGDAGRSLAGKRYYVVRPGDCLSHIAASLLPYNASTNQIEEEVMRLWRLNEERIGTGDPNLILVGTKLILR